MNILALESSGASVGVAAWRGASDEDPMAARSLAAWSSSEPRALSREIMRGIDETLAGAQWNLDDVDALAVGLGPGSWTSLRIGLSTAKTLAQARDWRLIGVPTLDALAQSVWRRARAQQANEMEMDDHLPQHFILLALAHCRADEVYSKTFECRPESLDGLQTETVDSPLATADAATVESSARRLSAPLVLIGDGSDAVARVLQARGQEFQVSPLHIEALAAEIARCGEASLAQGRDSDPLKLQPLYIAPSAAERNFQVKK